MIDFFATLGDDHALIAHTLDAFEAYLDRLDRGELVDRHELVRFIIFFTDFADGWHHRKEEEVLFPALARHGYALESGALEFIRDQHRREREIYSELRRELADRHAFTPERTKALVAASRGLVKFERNHMAKENELLFPAAAKELAEEGPTRIADDLAKFAKERVAGGHVDWLRTLAAELARENPKVS